MFWFEDKNSSKTESKFNLVLESSNDIILILNRKGKVLNVNDQVKKVLGIEKTEILGREFSSLPFLDPASDRNKMLLEKIASAEDFLGPIDTLDHYKNKAVFQAKIGNHEALTEVIIEGTKVFVGESESLGLKFLSEASVKLLEMLPEQEIYDYIANQLALLVSDSYIFVNTFPDKNTLKTVGAATSSKVLGRGIKVLGKNPVGQSYKMTADAQLTMKRGKLTKLSGGVYQLTFGQFPKTIADLAEKAAGIKSIFTIGMFWKGQLFGSATIITRKDTQLPENSGIIETFINLAAVAIQRKRAEDELQKTILALDEEKNKVVVEKDKTATILESIGDGVFVINKDQEIILFNQAAETITGFEASEVLNKKFDQILLFTNNQNKKPADKFIFNCQKSGQIERLNKDVVLGRKDKLLVPVDNTAAPLKDAGGENAGCVVVFRDVTRERQVDQAKTEFVSLASHQLRTPLSAINWYTEMLLSGDAGKISDKQKEFLSEVYASSRRMVELVGALLNVSRLELGTFIVEPEPTDLQKVAKSVVDELKPAIEKKKLKIEEKYDSAEKISADPKLVRIMFQNLISNAVKYTGSGGKVEISLKQQKADKKYPDGGIMFEVKDNGMGIPKSAQNQIFTKLFRADNVRVTSVEGTGLGLYIVKSIIENSGGRVWFESKENHGSTFYLLLPKSGMKKKAGSKSLN